MKLLLALSVLVACAFVGSEAGLQYFYKNPETVRKHMALMANDGSVDAMPQQAREIPEAIDILQSAPNHDAKFVKYYGNPYYYGRYGNPYYYGRYYSGYYPRAFGHNFGYNVMKVADPMKVTAKMKVTEVEPVSEEAEPESA